MAKDPYSVLGVAKNASADDIKKAYRALSKEWHPDKHKGDRAAEERFKEINRAYETLNDPRKKESYDRFGSTDPGAGAGGFDFSHFGNAADLGDIFGSFFGGGRAAANDDEEKVDKEIALTIDLADAVTGARKTVRLNRFVACDTCDGRGARKGTSIVTCKTCGGTGQTTRTVNSFFGQIRQRGVCATCGGGGKIPEHPCEACRGEGRVSRVDEVRIEIPPGIDAGQTLRVRDEGDAGRRGEPVGDLFVHMRMRRDPRFERRGSDIHAQATVPVIDAILGGTLNVETVHGSSTVEIPAGTSAGTILRLRDKGMPILGSAKHGDHHVHLDIDIPTKLSRAEKKILEQWREERA